MVVDVWFWWGLHFGICFAGIIVVVLHIRRGIWMHNLHMFSFPGLLCNICSTVPHRNFCSCLDADISATHSLGFGHRDQRGVVWLDALVIFFLDRLVLCFKSIFGRVKGKVILFGDIFNNLKLVPAPFPWLFPYIGLFIF